METIGNSNTEVMETIGIKTAELLATIGITNDVLMARLEEVLQNMICQRCKRYINEQDKQRGPIKPFKLGQTIFKLHHLINLTSVCCCRDASDIVLMDHGRMVMCLHVQNILLICNTEASQEDTIDLQDVPLSVTAVNNYTVAVTLLYSIEMYDINNLLKLKSITVPGMWFGSGITIINNKLVVSGTNRLLVIDHQTREVVLTIQTDCNPYRLHGSSDRIFYCDDKNNNENLYWYSYTDDRHHSLILPSPPCNMTTLQDGSLYVKCVDGSVQNVSSVLINSIKL